MLRCMENDELYLNRSKEDKTNGTHPLSNLKYHNHVNKAEHSMTYFPEYVDWLIIFMRESHIIEYSGSHLA